MTGGSDHGDSAGGGGRAGILAYGFEAPHVPALLAIGGCVCVGLGVVLARGWLVVAAILLAQAALFVHTTLRGKHRVWHEILAGAGLRGDERVLDLGCGRGAVLIRAAQILPASRGVGVDVWRNRDQSGNSPEVLLANARAVGVADRVRVETADLTALPFPDESFDLVLSALAIHNIPDRAGRRQAVDEARRVLRTGGQLLLADFRHTKDYQHRLGAAATRRRLGPDYWYGGPWAATALVSLTKPAPTIESS